MSRVLSERKGTAPRGYKSADDPRFSQDQRSSPQEAPDHLTTLRKYADATTKTSPLFPGRKSKTQTSSEGTGPHPDTPAATSAPAGPSDPKPPTQDPPVSRRKKANTPSCFAGLKPEYQGMTYGGIEGFKVNGGHR